MKILFMGTPEFAVSSLKSLIENGCQVVAVVTAADKPAGRGQKLQESAVKKYAQSQGIPILQPLKLKSAEFIEQLHSYQADLFIVVAFRMLPEIVWSMPRLGTFNLHGSLLPKYRGAAPINWAIINGEKETGVSTFFLKQEIDTGNIIDQIVVDISEQDSAGDLHDKLMKIGADLVLKTVKAIEKGEVKVRSQAEIVNKNSWKEQDIKHAAKIFKADCKIDWNDSANNVQNLIRGLSPYPTAFTEIKNNNLKIFKSIINQTQPLLDAGNIATDGKSYFRIACKDAWIELLEVQLEGKKRMPISDFLKGWRN